jgi:hypothetical protein
MSDWRMAPNQRYIYLYSEDNKIFFAFKPGKDVFFSDSLTQCFAYRRIRWPNTPTPTAGKIFQK